MLLSFKELAMEVADIPNLVIAKMNKDENDCEGLVYSQFTPGFGYFKRGENKKSEHYGGGPTAKNIQVWLSNNSEVYQEARPGDKEKFEKENEEFLAKQESEGPDQVDLEI